MITIDIDKVSSVLLTSGWHDVQRPSFQINEIAHYTCDGDTFYTAGPYFQFDNPHGETLSGPVSSIHAVIHF